MKMRDEVVNAVVAPSRTLADRARAGARAWFRPAVDFRSPATLERERWVLFTPMSGRFTRALVVAPCCLVQCCLGAIYSFSLFNAVMDTGVWRAPGTNALGFLTSVACYGASTLAFGAHIGRIGPFAAVARTLVCLPAAWLCAAAASSIGSLPLLLLGYGALLGVGVAHGYLATTSTMQRWYPHLRGAAAGVAVAGFGVGAFGWTLLGKALLDPAGSYAWGVPAVQLLFGCVQLCVLAVALPFLRLPPPGWAPGGDRGTNEAEAEAAAGDCDGGTAAETALTVEAWSVVDVDSESSAPRAGVGTRNAAAGPGAARRGDESALFATDSSRGNCANGDTAALAPSLDRGGIAAPPGSFSGLPAAESPPASPRTAPAGSGAASAALAPITATSRVPDRVYTLPQAARQREFWLLALLVFGSSMPGVVMLSSAADMAQYALGLPPGTAFAITAAQNAVNFGGRLCFGLLSDRVGRKSFYVLAAAAQAVAVAAMPAAFRSGSVALWVAEFMAVGALYGGTFGVLPALTSELFGPGVASATHGCMLTLWALSAVVGVPAFTAVTARVTRGGHPAPEAYAINASWLAALPAVATVAAALLNTRTRDRIMVRASARWTLARLRLPGGRVFVVDRDADVCAEGPGTAAAPRGTSRSSPRQLLQGRSAVAGGWHARMLSADAQEAEWRAFLRVCDEHSARCVGVTDAESPLASNGSAPSLAHVATLPGAGASDGVPPASTST